MLMKNLLDPVQLRALYFKRDLNGKQERPCTLMIKGPPGIGKSAVERMFPSLLSGIFGVEFGYASFTVPEFESVDMRGFMIPTKNKDGEAVSYYTYPAVLPSKEYFAKYPRGVVVVEESDQGDMPMSKALAAFFYEGRLGTVTMPPGWWVVGSSNRMEDRSGVIRQPMHIVNRVRTIQIEADMDSLITWQEGIQMHPLGVEFTRKFPKEVCSATVPKEARPFCTPRSFAEAMSYLKELATDDDGYVRMDIPSHGVAQECVSGNVGDGVSAQMFGYFRMSDQMPEFADILKDPMKAKCPTFERMDAAYATMRMCVINATAGNIDRVWTYAERFPKALQVPAAKELLNKAGGTLLNSKALGNWIAKNNALITNTMKS